MFAAFSKAAGELAQITLWYLRRPACQYRNTEVFPCKERMIIRFLHDLLLQPDEGFMTFAIEYWQWCLRVPMEVQLCEKTRDQEVLTTLAT